LIGADRALEQGIPVTAVARTALDLAAVVRFRTLRRLVRRSEELKVFDLADFRLVLDRNRGHRGAFHLERAIGIYEPPRLVRSELDVYWPELRFAVELDVYETHGGHESFEEDRRRDEDLKLAGIELIRVTGRRFEREPRKVVERIGRLLDQRRRQLETRSWAAD
jgi:hypothetical protein